MVKNRRDRAFSLKLQQSNLYRAYINLSKITYKGNISNNMNLMGTVTNKYRKVEMFQSSGNSNYTNAHQ